MSDPQNQQPGGFPPPPASGYGQPPSTPPPGGGYAAYQGGGQLALTGNGKRFGAYLLEALLMIVTLFIGWLIWWLIVMAQGQTPAKQVLKMRCVDANTGQLATYGQMALREVVGKMLLGNVTCGISSVVGAIMVLADEQRHQALWDKIGTTVVVEDPYDTLKT